MCCPKTIFISLVFTCTQVQLHAQKAKYADAYTGYNVAIAGIAGNSIHVWSASATPPYPAAGNIALTLHIFSADMHLQEEKKVELGEINSWSIEFQQADSFYYASIICVSGITKRLLLKIDWYGNVSNISDTPDLWTNAVSLYERNMFYAMTHKNNHLFSVTIENAMIRDSSGKDIISLPGENFTPGQVVQKLIIKKENTSTGASAQLIFGSISKRFYNPVIIATNKDLLVSASAQANNANNNLFLFFARLDTNLAGPLTRPVILKSKGVKNEIYPPSDIIQSENKVALISKGLYKKEMVRYYPEYQNGITVQVPHQSGIYITHSLKITMIDEKNNALKDTFITDQGNNKNLQWDNLLTLVSGKGIDIFCGRKYAANKNGITHFSMNEDGNMKEDDMIVDPRYDYLVAEAKELVKGDVLIPFLYKGKRGLMKLEYRPAE